MTPNIETDRRYFEASGRRYVGHETPTTIRIENIRYATAERFAEPAPLQLAQPGQDVHHPTPACPQLPQPADSLWGDPYKQMQYDEDCQRLTITTPRSAQADSSLPVMVWIHGGSYVSGGGDLPIYDPTDLVTEGDVIVVAVTYRIGMLGFAGDGRGTPANLGLLDLLAALNWIRESISAFGGDPNRVTLFGQSAGGDAIAHLMLVPAAQELFHRVIVQSAPLGIRGGRTRLNEVMDRAVGMLTADAPLEAVLEKQPVAYRAAKRWGLRSGMPFAPRYDCAPLPPEAQVEKIWETVAGRFDVLVGLNVEETTLFAMQSAVVRGVFSLPGVGAALKRALVKRSTAAVYGDGTVAFADCLRAGGGNVYEYQLDWKPSAAYGSTHSVELPLLFPSGSAWVGAPIVGDLSAEELHATGAAVRRIWTTFADTGIVREAATSVGVSGHIETRADRRSDAPRQR